MQHTEARGIKGLFITVDAPQLGRREKVSITFVGVITDANRRDEQDMRMKFTDDEPDAQKGEAGVDRSQGAARAISVSLTLRGC